MAAGGQRNITRLQNAGLIQPGLDNAYLDVLRDLDPSHVAVLIKLKQDMDKAQGTAPQKYDKYVVPL